MDNESPTVMFTNATAKVVEDVTGGMAELEISLTGSTSNQVTVSYATSTESGSGAATATSDFTGISTGTANIAAGQLTGTIRIPIINDDIDEQDESFKVTISNPQNSVLSSTTSKLTITVTITDDDVPEIFITAVGTAKEGINANADFLLTSDILPRTGLTIHYLPESTNFLDSEDTGVKQSTAQPLGFSQRDEGDPILATLRVPIDNDSIKEANGTIKVTLQDEDPAEVNYKIRATNYHATINVEDDDAKVPVLIVTAPTTGVAESVGSADFTVTAYDVQAKTNSINPGRPITVQYTPEEVDSGDFLSNEGTATTVELTFTETNGVWTDILSVALDNDTNPDPTGKIKVTLNDDPATIATYTVSTGTDKSAEATIWDDDAPELTILAGNAVTEGTDASATFKVIANVLPKTDLSIQYTPVGTSFIAGSGTKVTANPPLTLCIILPPKNMKV